MREIKFRGFNKESNKWAYGDLFKDYIHTYILVTERFDGYSSTKHVAVNPETVGQYIGLNDQDNHEIYESDIVEINLSSSNLLWEKCVVIFEDGAFLLHNPEKRSYLFGIPNLFKVIGNIYDSPTLLDVYKNA